MGTTVDNKPGGRTSLGDGGFSLVETLLAVLILAVGLTLVLRSFGSSLDALGNSAGYTRGVERARSEEHTSELQSRLQLVCRLLLEKKKKRQHHHTTQLPNQSTLKLNHATVRSRQRTGATPTTNLDNSLEVRIRINVRLI